jgi:predicted nucleic acid-binding protein
VDTDVFIDYLNGHQHRRRVLDSSRYRVYYSAVARKELLAKPGLTATERRRIRALLLRHRLIPIDEAIAPRFSSLLVKYAKRGLRKADALVAATAWSRRFPLATGNLRHYRFITEITLLNPDEL